MSINYINSYSLSFNEGGKYFNFHLKYGNKICGFYIYIFGKRFYKFIKLKNFSDDPI